MAESTTESKDLPNEAKPSENMPLQKKEEAAKRRIVLGRPPSVGLIGTILILATLFAAGLIDLFRWLLVVLTLQ